MIDNLGEILHFVQDDQIPNVILSEAKNLGSFTVTGLKIELP